MAKKYFATNVTSEGDYISKTKNIEIMKGAKNSKPTINYKTEGKDITQFLNYETFLSMVKGYTDMRTPRCCKSPPLTIIDGITSYQCEEEKCKFCKDPVLYPIGAFDNCKKEFYFPRKITTDPCNDHCPTPHPPPHPCDPCKTTCHPNLKGNMRPCCFKQTRPCRIEHEPECKIPVNICTNPLLRCYDPCMPCGKRT